MAVKPAIISGGKKMNFTIISSVVTVISLFVFLGILYWAFSSGNKERFEKLARLPIENENGK
ncbi:cbb3-type cytochrome c oxidase subunit 3 [Undibacterium sp. TS12]|uniref:cbb3-type cytochrome oxidase subunit 3 n=1 Tax=Undibacterium sp. TS12 TaxID=2908202 RepID=UPI003219959F